jgi:Cerato-platanin
VYKVHVDDFVLRVLEIYHVLVAPNLSDSCATEPLILLDLILVRGFMQFRPAADRHERLLSVLVAKKDRVLMVSPVVAMLPLCPSAELCGIKGTYSYSHFYIIHPVLLRPPKLFIYILQHQSTMKFTALISSLFVLGLSTVTLADSLSYDETYDNKSGSLSTTACSDGSNGLAKSYPTFGDLPNYP